METKKCPNCRAIIPSLTNVCEYCDTTVENVPTVSDTSSDKPSLDSAKELILENKLDQAEMVLIDIIWEPIDVKDYGEDRISTEDKEMIKIIDDKKQSLMNMINKKRAGN